MKKKIIISWSESWCLRFTVPDNASQINDTFKWLINQLAAHGIHKLSEKLFLPSFLSLTLSLAVFKNSTWFANNEHVHSPCCPSRFFAIKVNWMKKKKSAKYFGVAKRSRKTGFIFCCWLKRKGKQWGRQLAFWPAAAAATAKKNKTKKTKLSPIKLIKMIDQRKGNNKIKPEWRSKLLRHFFFLICWSIWNNRTDEERKDFSFFFFSIHDFHEWNFQHKSKSWVLNAHWIKTDQRAEQKKFYWMILKFCREAS